jgi:hypothetical protein
MRRLVMIVVAATAYTIQPAAAGDYIYDAVAAKVSRQCVDQVRSRGFHHFEAFYNDGIVPFFVPDRHAFYWFEVCMSQAGFPLR